MTVNEDQQNEKIGGAIVWISWIFFALKFIGITSLIALVVLFFIHKPLWIAPIIGVGLFLIYRLGWRLVWTFIGLVSKSQVTGPRVSQSRISKPPVSYDPAKQEPVIHASICTGEKVAGFKDLEGGHFTEVMLIRTDADLKHFMNMYGLKEVKTEY